LNDRREARRIREGKRKAWKMKRRKREKREEGIKIRIRIRRGREETSSLKGCVQP
jgi:hypothetical protein